jgi:hypothetical protein
MSLKTKRLSSETKQGKTPYNSTGTATGAAHSLKLIVEDATHHSKSWKSSSSKVLLKVLEVELLKILKVVGT